MARQYREWTGYDWQTNRNSGRTDLPGDIYSPEFQSRVFIECKHRQSFSIKDILKQNRAYTQEVAKVLQEWEEVRGKGYPLIHFWRKDEYGLWIFCGKQTLSEIHGEWPQNHFETDYRVSVGEHDWRRVVGIKKGCPKLHR